MTYLMIFIIGIYIYCATVISWLIFKNIISPFSVYALANGVSLVLATINWNNLDFVRFEVYVWFFVANIMMLIGSILAQGGRRKIKQFKLKESHKEEELFIVITGTVGLIGMIILSLNILTKFSFIFIITTPAILQKNFQTISGVGYMNTLNLLVIPAIVYSIVIKKNIKPKYFFFAFTSIIALILAGNKTYIMMSILTAFYISAIHQKTILKFARNISFVIIFVFGYFIWYFNHIDVGLIGTAVEALYSYLSSSWIALGNMLRDNMKSEKIGYYTLYFFYKVNAVITNTPLGNNYMPFTNIPSLFNVYTSLGELFSDYGYYGIVGGQILFGYIGAKAKKNWDLNKQSFFPNIVYALILTNVTMTFFVSFITQPYMIVNFIYIFLFAVIIKGCRKRHVFDR